MATIPAHRCLRSSPPPHPPGAPRLPGRTTLVSITGDLDAATHDLWYQTCIAATGADIRVDLTATTFIDCRGYAALAAARQTIQARGGTLTLQGVHGPLALLLQLIRSTRDHLQDQPAPTDLRCTRTRRW